MIKIDNVSIGYNSLVIRDNLNYTFEQDKIYGILGESGVGKTTFLKTIAGLLKPIKGTIEMEKGLKRSIYMMHQSYTCFDWLTCFDNILITERIKHHKITKQIKSNAYNCGLSANRIYIESEWKKYQDRTKSEQYEECDNEE